MYLIIMKIYILYSYESYNYIFYKAFIIYLICISKIFGIRKEICISFIKLFNFDVTQRTHTKYINVAVIKQGIHRFISSEIFFKNPPEIYCSNLDVSLVIKSPVFENDLSNSSILVGHV